jgi:hypothetical protein
MTNQEPATQAVVIEPQIQVVRGVHIPPNEPSQKIKITATYAKSVRFFAAIEIFFLIFFGLYQPWFLLQAIGPIFGYYGAKNFHVCSSYFYFIYLILASLSKFIFLALIFNPEPFYILLTFLSIIIDIWILKITSAFLHHLNDLTADELLNIQHMHILTTYVYW